MAEQIDVVAIASMPEEDREATMGQLFHQLLPLDPAQQQDSLEHLIRAMGEHANDQQYLDLCATNLKLASMLPDADLARFLSVRLNAAAALPPNLAERDMNLMQQALKQSDASIQKKISLNMPASH